MITGEWHSYVAETGDGEIDPSIHIVGFLVNGLTPDDERALCEVVVPSSRDGHILRDALRALDAKPWESS